MRPYITDLFGEIPVTHQDVDAWLISVPGIQPGTKRAAHYIEAWSVVEKIRQAKRTGTFDALTAKAEAPSPGWWHRFSWVRGSGF